MIILLDGSKGAGKSSAAEILVRRLKGIVHLSIDNERRALQSQTKDRTERNREAFEQILRKTKEIIKAGGSVVIDCGLTTERISTLESLALETNSKIYKFLLKAPYDTLLERVRSRDAAKGKTTDVERFDEIFKIIHSKQFEGFVVIETDKMSPEEVGTKILSAISLD